MKDSEMHELQISFRLTKAMFERIENLRAAMVSQSVGIEVERTKVIRLTIERGLENLEIQFGLKK